MEFVILGNSRKVNILAKNDEFFIKTGIIFEPFYENHLTNGHPSWWWINETSNISARNIIHGQRPPIFYLFFDNNGSAVGYNGIWSKIKKNLNLIQIGIDAVF